MSVRFGVAPIAWTNSDLPQLGGDTTLETCLLESREAGYSGTETGVKFPMDPEELGPILRAHDLKLVSGWFSGGLLAHSLEQEKQNIEAQLSLFVALGAPVLVYAETTGSVQADRTIPLSQRPTLSEAEIADYGKALTELAVYLEGRGMALTYHPHMGTVFETERDTDLLMAATGKEVGLLIDTGHMTFAEGDVIASTRRHAGRLNHVHCKDIRPEVLTEVKAQDKTFLDAVLDGVFTVPGDGCIDFHGFARELAAIPYSGWVVVEAEQDPAKAPPLEYARMGHAHLTACFTEAGLEISR